MTAVDWGEAPEVRSFHGRADEVRDIEDALVRDDRRVVFVQGLSGAGKTHLSLGAVRRRANSGGLRREPRPEIVARFDRVLWFSLADAPGLDELCRRAARAIPGGDGDAGSAGATDPAAELMAKMRATRCLLMLDNLESLLDVGAGAPFRAGYEGYETFLRRFADAAHESCIMLTSREAPMSLAPAGGSRDAVLVYRVPPLDEGACGAVLAEHGVVATPELAARVVAAFGANPLLLGLVARRAVALHGGDVSQLLTPGEMAFARVRGLLDWHFDRLTPGELDLAYCLAVSREALDLAEIARDLAVPPAAAGDLVAALDARFPLERQDGRFTLHPAFVEYAVDRLVAEVARDAASGSVALLDRLALLKTSARERVRRAQRRLLLAPVGRAIAALPAPSPGIEGVSLRLLAECRARGARGFAAGNVLNLMREAGIDLAGWDLSSLAIKGADLQRARLVGTDFSACAFSGCTFATDIGTVLAVAVTPDGRAVVTGDNRGSVTAWRVEDGAEDCRFEGHRDWVRTIAFSADGAVMATGGSDFEVRLWEVATGRLLAVLRDHTQQVYSVSFQPGGTLLASGAEDSKVILWDAAASYRRVRTLDCVGRVRSVRFDPTGRLLAIGCGRLEVRPVADDAPAVTLDLAGDHVRRAVFDPEGQFLAYAVGSGGVRVADPATLATVHTLTVRKANWIEFSPDGRTLAAACDDGAVRRWSVAEGFTEAPGVEGHPGSSARAVAFAPASDLMASGGEDGVATLWELPGREALRSVRGYANGIRCVAWSSDGQAFAAACEDGGVHVWDADDPSPTPGRVLEGHRGAVEAVAFPPRGTRLLSAGDDGTARIWDLADGTSVRLDGHAGWVWCAAYGPGGRTMATGGRDGRVIVWDTAAGELVADLAGHVDEVHCVAFLGAGRLASGSDDHTVRLWDLEGQAARTIAAHDDCVRALAFNAKRNLLASAGDDGAVKLWTESGEHVHTFREHRRRVRSVVFAPDGVHLYSAGDDALVRKWDLSGACVAEFEGHRASVWSLALDPSGTRLLSGGADGFLMVHRTDGGGAYKSWPTRRYEGMRLAGATGLRPEEERSLPHLGATFGGAPRGSVEPGGRGPPDVPDSGVPSGTGPPDTGRADREATGPSEPGTPDGRPSPDPVVILADLFPGGPTVTGIWERAGGDSSRLDASGDGNAQWRAALGKFRRGGGGANITAESLFAVVRDEYPRYSDLPALERALASLSPR